MYQSNDKLFIIELSSNSLFISISSGKGSNYIYDVYHAHNIYPDCELFFLHCVLFLVSPNQSIETIDF